MTAAEAFSWCACLAIGALSWLAAGIPGTLCMIVGMIISQIDVGWIEDRLAEHAKVDAVAPPPVTPPKRFRKRKSAPNVIPFPTQRAS